MQRRRKKRVAFRFYVFMALAGIALAYGAYIAVDGLVRRTAVIESGNMGNQYAATAVVVRNEELTDAEGLTSITYFADEGEPVYKGNKIAEIYSSGYSQTDMNKLLNVRAQIKAYHQTLLASAYTDLVLDRYDEQILTTAREIGALVRGGERGNLLGLQRQLEDAMGSRQLHLRTRYESDQNLRNLYDTESSLLKKIESWTVTYLADQDCIVSFYTDGYENTLRATEIDAIDAAMARAVIAGEAPQMTTAQRGRTAVFRTVQNDGWALLLVSHDKNWNPVVGQTYKVELTGFEDSVFDGVVASFARAGSEVLVRMTIRADVRPVLNLRVTQARVGELYVSGLKVPINALYRWGSEVGVVLTDGNGVFVPVTIIMQDNDFAIVQPVSVGALSEGQKIRVF